MALLYQKASDLLICVENKIIKYNLKTNEDQVITIPEIILPKNLRKGKEVQAVEASVIITACVSEDAEYLAVSTQKKQVVVYNNNYDVVENFVLNRVASKIGFSHDGDILIADKTGDAYCYKLKEETNLPTLILGHLSMLLDIITTRCGKYIVTCDRDEKIRVSHYPNAYSINSYCLGHEEFVTKVEVIEDVLISASGDGTVRFWNFLTGRELHRIVTNDHVNNKDIIESFCKEMDMEKCEVTSLPVTNMQVLNNGNVYIAVTLLNYACIQIYLVEDIRIDKISSKFLQNIMCDSPPVSFSLSEHLFVLLNNGILLFHLNNNVFESVMSEKLIAFYNKNESILRKPILTNDISVLYKRKFDNVQEYLERKKQRLETK